MSQPPEPELESALGLTRVWMTLFAVEQGDTAEEPGYIVRFLTTDRSSHARLAGLLFSLPEDRVRHLMNNVWWVHEEAMDLLVQNFPTLGAQIVQLAAGDTGLPPPPELPPGAEPLETSRD